MALADEVLLRVSAGTSLLARYFCFTSSVVKGAPVLRTAPEEDDSAEELESLLAERAVFLCDASEDLRVAGGAGFVCACFLCCCC